MAQIELNKFEIPHSLPPLTPSEAKEEKIATYLEVAEDSNNYYYKLQLQIN